jgi:integration host factor subunit beta
VNKSQLVDKLAKTAGINRKAAAVAVDVACDAMAEVLAKGGRIELRGFGTIKVKNYEGYLGRNPKYGGYIAVGPKKLPAFKQAGKLRERLNGKVTVTDGTDNNEEIQSQVLNARK